jgi:hypothetical protein
VPRAVPYIFCRFALTVEGDQLDDVGTIALLEEHQGSLVPHRTGADGGITKQGLIMAPRKSMEEGEACVSFSIGYQPGSRTKTGYDKTKREITRVKERDSHIKSAHVVMLPALQCMAVEDRSGDDNVAARTALSVLRSVVAGASDGEGELNVIHISDSEVREIVENWQLTEYLYTVRPLNPVTLSDMATLRSDAMKAERVAQERGKLVPEPGKTMEANGGIIAQTQEYVDVGYGQNGFRAITPGGHTAHVPKPAFHMERAKNLAERAKPRYLRVMFDVSSNEEMTTNIASSLERFYRRDERKT